jgi:hypothetical protein
MPENFPGPPILLMSMHLDTNLKTLFQSSRLRLLESLTGVPVREWLNVEIPNFRMSKLDEDLIGAQSSAGRKGHKGVPQSG